MGVKHHMPGRYVDTWLTTYGESYSVRKLLYDISLMGIRIRLYCEAMVARRVFHRSLRGLCHIEARILVGRVLAPSLRNIWILGIYGLSHEGSYHEYGGRYPLNILQWTRPGRLLRTASSLRSEARM